MNATEVKSLILFMPASIFSGRCGIPDASSIIAIDINNGAFYRTKESIPEFLHKDVGEVDNVHDIYGNQSSVFTDLIYEPHPYFTDLSVDIAQRALRDFAKNNQAFIVDWSEVDVEKMCASPFIDFGLGNWHYVVGVHNIKIIGAGSSEI